MILWSLAWLPLVVVLALVWLAVRRRPGAGTGDPHAVRRFFQYLLLYGLFVVVVIGLGGLVGRLFGPRPESVLVGQGEALLARDLSFVAIGTPLYAILGWVSLQRLRADPGERSSFGWLVYSTSATITALAFAMPRLHAAVAALLGPRPFQAWEMGGLLVGGLAWWGHWLAVRRLPSTVPELPLLIGSAVGLVASALGLVGLLSESLEVLAPGREMLVVGSGMDRAGASLVAGGAVWVPHWWAAMRGERTPLWFAYVFVLGVAGALLAVLASSGVVVWDVLVWWIGDPRVADAGARFEDVPGAVATAAVGGLIWWYHRAVVTSGETERGEPRRIYEYLMAGVGLVAAAGGATALLIGLLEAVGQGPSVVAGETAANTLLGAATFLLIGEPVWWYFWRRIQRLAPGAEVRSPTRRVYLFAVLGSAVVVAVTTLIALAFVLIEAVLEGRGGTETLLSVRLAAASLLVSAAVAAYHWAVYASDRDQVPAVTPGPRHILLLGSADDATVRDIRQRTGARVEVWGRTDSAPPWSAGEVVEARAGVTDEEVVVVATVDGPQVIGVERR